jgi:hypothetical protein
MPTRTKVPAWIQRRISERPVARWISWDSGRPRETDADTVLTQRAVQPSYGDNVVFLFPRVASCGA